MPQLLRMSDPGITYMDKDRRTTEEWKTYYDYRRLLRKVLTPTEYLVFDIIEDKTSETKAGWRISYTEISDLGGGLASHTVSNAILRLEELELLVVDRQVNFNQKISNMYHPVKWPTPNLVNFLLKESEKILDAKNAAKASRCKNNSEHAAKNASTSLQKMQTYDTHETHNELTTPNGVAAPPSKTIDLPDYKPIEQEEPLPMSSSRLVEATKPGPASDKGRAGASNSKHIPPKPPSDLAQEGKGFEAGGDGGRDMTHVPKARDKPKPKGKEPDPNSIHPACLVWQETHNKKLPNTFQMVDIVAQVGDDPSRLAEWRECLIYYARHPHWNQVDSDKILHCYKNQNYKKGEVYGQGGNGKPGYRGNGASPTQQSAGSYGRGMGKFSALGPSGRLTDEQLEKSWD